MGLSSKTLDSIHRFTVNLCFGLGIVGMGMTGITLYNLFSVKKTEAVQNNKKSEELE